MSPIRSRPLPLLVAGALAACAPESSADVAALRTQTEALERRVAALEKAGSAGAAERTDAALASTLAVVQAVGRGQDPTTLDASDQVAFCRATGWTVRDLEVLGARMRGGFGARDAALAQVRRGGVETPTDEQVLATEPGRLWAAESGRLRRVHEALHAGRWAAARDQLLADAGGPPAAAPAPRPPAGAAPPPAAVPAPPPAPPAPSPGERR